MTPTRRLIALLALTLPALGPACPTASRPRGHTHTLQRAKWASHGIRHYRYEFQRSCECLPSMAPRVRIEVRDGAVVSVVDAQTGEPLPDVSPANKPTIDELFAELARAYREADRVDAEYDRTFGYPTRVNIDWDIDVADEERIYVARNLTRLD